MKIEKVLNNNVVVTKNSNGQEVIAMGCGIAFKKTVGELLEAQKVEKIFTLNNPEISNKLKELVSEIPMDYVLLSEKIISFALMSCGKKLNDNIYIALTDHIYTAVERYKKGITLKNGLLWETKRLYKEEFRVGKEAINIIHETFQIQLPEDEAGFIALHIVNAQLDEQMPMVMNITKLMQEILNIVKYHFSVDYDEESLAYYRFVTHLKFFAQRLFSQTHYEARDDEDLYEMVKGKFKEEYVCVKKIADFISKQYAYDIHNEEMLYLMIHISHVVYKNKR